MAGQDILEASENYTELDSYFREAGGRPVLIVCGRFVLSTKLGKYFGSLEERLGIKAVTFSGFGPNPLYESVAEGVDLFRKGGCGSVVAIGGGSAMDVAKCIKLYSNMDPARNYLEQEIVPNDIRLLAVPTTAGTGSEATRYAVIYYKGAKQSVAHDSCIPSAVLFDASLLRTLPEYQRKSTMMDALCHAIESYWSVNSDEESRQYSRAAIGMILANKDPYLANDDEGNAAMLKAANLAGKAINIAQTTAGHAMCYKLTSIYGISHGHAAALCVSGLFPYMAGNTDKCIDPRGAEYLNGVFKQIAAAMGCSTADEAAGKFGSLLGSLGLAAPEPCEEDYGVLKASVNLVRLKNHPIGLDAETIDKLYHQILMKR